MSCRLRARLFEVSLALLWAVAILFNTLQLTHLDPGHPTAFVGGFDENSYFAMAHSMLFDGDLNCANEFRFIQRSQPPYLFEAFRPYVEKAPENPQNLFPIGTSLFAVPAMAVARVAVAIAEEAHGQPYSSYSPLYVLAYFAANITYGVLAIWLAFQTLLRWFPRRVAAFACWSVILTGTFLFYSVFDPGMSHMTSGFLGALAVFAWLRWRDSDDRKVLIWGAVCGLAIGAATTVRPYNAPLALMIVAQAAHGRRDLRWISSIALAGLGGFLGFAPQLLAWHAMHGTWIANTDAHSFSLVPRYAGNVLFSRRHGFFFWNPAMLLAVCGLLAGLRSHRRVATWFLLMLAGFIWMYGNWREWWLGVAFGMRGLDQVAIFAFGFAVAAGAADSRWPRRGHLVACGLLTFFAILNCHLILAFRSGTISHDGALVWRDSIRRSDLVSWQVWREFDALTPFGPGYRAPLLTTPVPGVE